ncbi:MAG: KpsF/GutQ family sugar-phosphate isomerase [Planctomycetes bacterium]|nr:KpsF/GutQ family sugar-phosphate isomerase [Planctomycetota bacterium]
MVTQPVPHDPPVLHRRAAELPVTDREVLQLGREVLAAETKALAHLVNKLDRSFSLAIHLLHDLRGNLIITGMGKAGLIAQKLVATFASTGTRAHFLHPAEAFHGDLGRVRAGDVVLVLSQSGETGEVVQLLPSLQKLGVPLIAITASEKNTLGQAAEVTIELGKLGEACWLGLAPSTSTTAMLAIGDALALVLSRIQGFQPEDFARFHPGGSLGHKLSHVEDHMRSLAECRIASADETVRQVLVACTKPGRRTGAIMLTDVDGRLVGLFTDSDLAKLIEQRNEAALDLPVDKLMVTKPRTVLEGSKMSAAVEILAERKISELPVVDVAGKPVGLIDVTDVVSLLPEREAESGKRNSDDGPTTIRIFPES